VQAHEKRERHREQPESENDQEGRENEQIRGEVLFRYPSLARGKKLLQRIMHNGAILFEPNYLKSRASPESAYYITFTPITQTLVCLNSGKSFLVE
jgi:hypothetical protein